MVLEVIGSIVTVCQKTRQTMCACGVAPPYTYGYYRCSRFINFSDKTSSRIKDEPEERVDERPVPALWRCLSFTLRSWWICTVSQENYNNESIVARVHLLSAEEKGTSHRAAGRCQPQPTLQLFLDVPLLFHLDGGGDESN